VAAVVLVGAVVLVALGRIERRSEQRHNVDGIARVRALVGGNVAHPADFRQSTGLSCLLYGGPQRVFALELCIDPSGRLVEAVDRRAPVSKFYSVTSEPSAARQRLDPGLVARLIAELAREAAAGAARGKG